MSNYLKEYEVLGRKYGIEDFKSPGKHFFDGKDGLNGKSRPRFMLWAGGCGIGYAKTLTEANDHLYLYIYETLISRLQKAKDEYKSLEHAVGLLGLCNNNLATFKIKKGKK